jgi:hypothetical protein
MKARWLAVVLATAVLTPACATTKVRYSKPGVTEAERKQDENECLRTALDHTYRAHILTPIAIDREVFQSCLESRGYSAGRE